VRLIHRRALGVPWQRVSGCVHPRCLATEKQEAPPDPARSCRLPGEALRLSPRDVAAHHWMSSAGTSKLHLGKDEEAVAWFRRAIDANRNFAFTHLSLAAVLAHVALAGC
jgi:hypothetical protein